MFSWKCAPIIPDVHDMLWHIASGATAGYMNGVGSEVQWVKYGHRGIQPLDEIDIPRKERRYVFAPRFELRVDQAFDEVVSACADPDREGHTWITSSLAEGYRRLFCAGFAHSFECWCDGALAGGFFALHVGGYISCESMFHRVSNASKSAWGQAILMLRDWGFKWVDTVCVSEHHVQYGERWVAEWKFQEMLREALAEERSLTDGAPGPTLPWAVRARLPLARLETAVGRWLRPSAVVAAGATS